MSSTRVLPVCSMSALEIVDTGLMLCRLGTTRREPVMTISSTDFSGAAGGGAVWP